ncbi:hypothetical protein KKC44_04305 [Patescibacteria group bacterium]|nr:hypothetical protein [Patescibacteria group bacterium]MBU2259800.1 hypothetical protein [Patescibacteria group bacterium]
MKFPLLKEEFVKDAERHFVETQCDGGNPAHQQKVASEIYLSATIRNSTKEMISSAKKITKSNKFYSWAMLVLTGALVLATAFQAYTYFISRVP